MTTKTNTEDGVPARRCSKCLELKPCTEFYADRTVSSGHKSRCKECWKESRPLHAHRQREYRRRWANKNKERTRGFYQEWKYGLTPEQIRSLWLQQNGTCDICGKQIPEPLQSNRETHIDHCHKIGNVRGILCRSCNLLLGCCEDNPRILEHAMKYLQSHGVNS